MSKLPEAVDRSVSNFLKNVGAVRPEQYYQSAMLHTTSHQGIVENLIERGIISERAIQDKISERHGLKKTDIEGDMFNARPFAETITDEFIIKNRLIPYQDNGNSLSVMVADADAITSALKLQSMVGKEIDIRVAPLFAFEKYIGQLASQTSNSNKPKQSTSTTANNAKAGESKEAESDIIDFVSKMFEKAIRMKTSDIHLEAYKSTFRIRFRKDGVLKEIQEYREFLIDNYQAIVARIKILSALDISERRLPQDGGMTFYLDDKKIDIRVSILPTKHGERGVLRIMNHEVAKLSLEQLGMTEDDLANVKKAICSPQGMILVTGPTGSGKSTTLYSVIKARNEPDVNILTVEDPVEYDMEGIGQVAVKDSIGLTFASALRSFLRQDPEVIMVGEIRDAETSDIAIKAALTGHLVLSTLHTNDAPSTVTRLRNMGVPAYLLSSSLTLIVAQRLVRINCDKCRVLDDDQNPARLISVGFPEDKAHEIKTYSCKGCDACMKTGVKGRKAIHEALVVSPAIKDAILNSASEPAIRELARKEGFSTMQDKGRALVASGMISLKEYLRVLMTE